eukprot:gnl/TRDRNA2_/TRDRNA2_144496_c0_seq1.p1 gnl/TRDRNA2_/TRDRNA2_144496_c0~~gnl/TRDRNA2_/TRDRNA2_144496_c0_seq1.p1  ORF type:complete len:144 (+),score=6.49 gnl/TRDRNA2_/TRDRNA2_144496_c0_seq1:27-434(+)
MGQSTNSKLGNRCLCAGDSGSCRGVESSPLNACYRSRYSHCSVKTTRVLSNAPRLDTVDLGMTEEHHITSNSGHVRFRHENDGCDVPITGMLPEEDAHQRETSRPQSNFSYAEGEEIYVDGPRARNIAAALAHQG